MVSQRKLEANRRNAQKSTGPKSEEGKAASRQNAFKHGMYSSSPLLPGEDPAEFAEFREGLVNELHPRGPMELLLVDRIVCSGWRLRRVGQIENWLFEHEGKRTKYDDTPASTMAWSLGYDGHSFERLSLQEQRLQRTMQAALRQLMQLQKQNRKRAENDTAELEDEETSSVTRASGPCERCTHGPEAHVTDEVTRTESTGDFEKIRNEPTDCPNPLPAPHLNLADLVAPVPLNARRAGIQSRDF